MSEKYNKITPEILEELKSIVGPDNMATDESAIEAYSCDESGKVYARMPDVVVKPETLQLALEHTLQPSSAILALNFLVPTQEP